MKVIIDNVAYNVISFAISEGFKVYTLKDNSGNFKTLQIELEY